MRVIGNHNPCLIIADGDGAGADAVVFRTDVPSGPRLRVQDVSAGAVSEGADLLLLRAGEITNRPLIETCALSGIPLLLCTGGSTLKEITRAVGWHQLAFRGGVEQLPSGPRVAVEGGGRLVLLHGGPNLRAMGRIHDQTYLPVGYEGYGCEALAVAAGACVLLRPGGDGLADAVKLVREAESLLGEARVQPSDDANVRRRAVVAGRDLPQGRTLETTDLTFRSPGPGEGGFAPHEAEGVVGRKLKRKTAKGEPITDGMLEGKTPEPPEWFSPRPPRVRPSRPD